MEQIKFDNYCFKADNDLDALDRVYEMVNQAEKYCNLKHLLPTDTCVADCLYEEKRGRFRHVLSTCKFKFTFCH